MSVRVRLPAPKQEMSMTHQNCIFCKIIARQVPATIIAENEQILVIQDKAPKAPIHYLILPKKHIANIQSLQPEDAQSAAAILMMAQQLSKQLAGSQACKLVINNGADAGQVIFHLHCHFLSGKAMIDI